jgi:hypothetical protein
VLLVRSGVRTPENVHHVKQVLMHSPRKSVKCLSHQLNFEASSMYRIIQEDVRLFPYRIQMQQVLYEVYKTGEKSVARLPSEGK